MAREVVSIFVSSPSDVKPERDIVSRVIGQLRRDFAARYELREVLWERRALLATTDPQGQIDRELPSTAIMVVILWTRLGSLLPPERVRGPISGRSVTGTEWEFENGCQAFAAKGIPQIVVYRKHGAAIARPDASPEEFTRLRTQLEGVDDFFQRWFANSDGTAKNSYRQFSEPAEFEELVTQHLRHLLEQRLGARGAKIEWAGNPFLGLLSYEPEHARIFFGRTRARHALRAALERRLDDGLPFLLVVGGSGCGKSSLVKAGLVPDLRAGHWLPGVPDSRFAIMRPSDAGGSPLEALAAAIVGESHALPELTTHPSPLPPPRERVAAQPPGEGGVATAPAHGVATRPAQGVATPSSSGPSGHLLPQAEEGAEQRVATLARLLRDDPAAARAAIIAALRAVTDALVPRVRGQVALTIVVDQLEELFTAGIAPNERERFVSVLRTLATCEPRRTDDTSGDHDEPRILIVATMRSDFFHRIEEVPALARLATGAAIFPVHPPDDDDITEIVRRPVEAAGLRFERDDARGLDLGEEIADAAQRSPSSLPLLSFLLDQLCQAASQDGRDELRFADHEALGGLEGALARRAEETLLSLPADAQAALPEVLGELVQVGDGATLDNAAGAIAARWMPLNRFPDGSPARALIDSFLSPAARLLVADGDPTAPRVRVAHEALLTRWQRARQQIDRDREFLLRRDRLALDERRYRDAPEDARETLLIPAGVRLDEARGLLAQGATRLDRELRAFIERSSEHQRHRATRRRRTIRAVIASLAVLAAAATALALVARIAQRSAETQRVIAALSSMEATSGATRTTDPWRAAMTLREIPAEDGSAEAVRTARDLLSMPFCVARLDSPGPTMVSLAVSPDGRHVAAGCENGSAVLWDVRADGVPSTIVAAGTTRLPASVVQFSADGSRLLVQHGTRQRDWTHALNLEVARVHDVTTGTLVREFGRAGGEPGERIAWAALNPDGHLLVASDGDGVVRVRAVDDDTIMETLLANPDRNPDAPPNGTPVATPLAMAAAALSADGSRVAILASDGTISIWSIDGRLIDSHAELSSQPEPVGLGDRYFKVRFTENGTVVGEREGRLRAWRPDGDVIGLRWGPRDSQERPIASSPSHRLLMQYDSKSAARSWRWRIRRFPAAQDGRIGDEVLAMSRRSYFAFATFVERRRAFVVVAEEGVADIVPLGPTPDPAEATTASIGDVVSFGISPRLVKAAAVSDDGSSLAALDESGSTITVMNLEPAPLDVIVGRNRPLDHPWLQSTLPWTWSADGARLFESAKSDGETDPRSDWMVAVRAASAGYEPVARLRTSTPVVDLATTPAGDVLVTGEVGGNVRVFRPADTDDGRIKLASLPGTVGAVAVSPDGTHVAASRRGRSGIHVWRLPGPGETALAPPVVLDQPPEGSEQAEEPSPAAAGVNIELGFSADGAVLLARRDDGTAEAFAVDGSWRRELRGDLRDEFRPEDAFVTSADLDPHGRRAVFVNRAGGVWIVDLSGHGPARQVDEKADSAVAVHFSADGSSIAYVDDAGRAIVAPADGAGQPLELRPARGAARSVTFDPGGRRIAIGRMTGGLEIWRLEGPRLEIELELDGVDASRVAFTSSGDALIVEGWDGTCRVVNALDWPALRRLLWDRIPQRLTEMERILLLGFEPLGAGDGR